MSTTLPGLSVPVRAPLIKRLPPFSPVALRLMTLMGDQEVSFKDVAKVFTLDPVLAGRVLQLANSGMYGRQFPVQSVLHALAVLGLKNVSRIAITAALSTGLPRKTSPWIRTWWRHSIATALVADRVATAKLDPGYGYTAGLLHGIGQLALFQDAPEEYPKLMEAARAEGTDLLYSERQMFGVDHAELAGLIMAEWGLPHNLELAAANYRMAHPKDALTASVQTGCCYAESQGFGNCGCLPALGEDVPGDPERALEQYPLEFLAVDVNRIECSLG